MEGGIATWFDQLEPTDNERMKKMSEEKVKKQMVNEGRDPEALVGVSLAKLKEAIAEIWVKRREEELQGAVGGETLDAGEPVAQPAQVKEESEEEVSEEESETVEIVRIKLHVERERIFLEKEKMQREHDLKKEKAQREYELEKEKMQTEQEKLKAELEFKKLELQQMAGLKKEKLKMLDEKNVAEKQRMESSVYKAKLFSDVLRGTMARMPSDPIEMIPYFRTVEKLFTDFKVEPVLKVHLLKPHLTEQARILIAKMDPAKSSDYEEVTSSRI